VTEPRDPFENWLHTEVEPMQPPPGTFEQIRKRARRRKIRRAAMSAASAGVAAGVIVLAVVALPKMVPGVLHLKSHPASAADTAPRHSVGHGTTASKGAHTMAPSTSPPPSTPASGGTGPVPPHFAPSSVTFVSLGTGFVIGQAGTPGRCANSNPYICTSVAVTTDAGRTWRGLPAPDTGGPDGGTGVSQIRFIDASTGWAFGPELWVTRDGGLHWARVNTHGMRVTSLETAGGMAYAVFARCTGTGADFAATCKHVGLYSSPTASSDWTPIAGGLGRNNGYVSAKVVLGQGAGSTAQGYFYEPAGTVLTGQAVAGASWTLSGQTPAPCQPLGAQRDGQPAGGQLAATSNGGLALACPGSTGSTGSNQETIYTSSDGGQSWQQQASVTVSGTATSLSYSGGVLMLATTQDIYTSSDGGQSWQPAVQGVTGGFSYVGQTSSTQAVAVPADPGRHHAVWFTFNGGQSWRAHPVTNG
jgi:hypothetical protein